MDNDAQSASDSLATKIESLELTVDEVAVLDALLTAAEASAEVEGFHQRSPAPLNFGLPDLRGRMKSIVAVDPFEAKQADPRSVVINHEEQ